jgi:hypothetical protein
VQIVVTGEKWMLGVLLLASVEAIACSSATPIKLMLKGPIVPAQKIAGDLRMQLPCRDETSALVCMCRPLVKATFEVTLGFRWKTIQMSKVSSERMKELGDALRSIEGYSGVTVKQSLGRSQDRVGRAVQQQRRNGVGSLLMIAPEVAAHAREGGLESEGGPAARSAAAPAGSRWIRQKFVINAVFV